MSTSPARRLPRHAVSLRGPYAVVALGAAVSIGTATASGSAQFDVPFVLAFGAGALVGLLAVAALPSIPTRVATALALVAGGFVLTRYARTGAVPARAVLIWALATVVTLAALEHAEATGRRRLDRTPVRFGAAFTRSATTACFFVIALAIALWPVLSAAGDGAQRGDAADPFSDAGRGTLADTARLDTRSRPALSDAIVMTVAAERPAFWRGSTFDTWDGRVWTRTDGGDAARLLRSGSDDAVIVPQGVGARVGESRTNEQTFEIAADYSDIVFAAPELVEIDSDHFVSARADGTVIAPLDPFGRGARYTARSEEPVATAETLRDARGTVPDEIVVRYAQPAITTERLRALAREITAGAPSAYDKVRAIERWLGEHVEYSLDAPLPPESTPDTVDWFVFEGRAGWCEQIASTLVVMMREVGVPARLATGFVTGEHDDLTGRYTVRERDAHAWAEVWFPGVGWQGFDPTARVPLAGESTAPASMFVWVQRHGMVLAAGAIVVAVVFWILSAALQWWRARRRRPAPTWAASVLADLERLGARCDRAREPAETPAAYAGALALLLEASELVGVGAAIDADAFGAAPISSSAKLDARRTIDRVLS